MPSPAPAPRSSALLDICARRREHVAKARLAHSFADLESAARATAPVRPFAASLRHAIAARGHGVICESKRRSPSGGDLRPDLSPAEAARAFAEGGAACLSVLTEPDFFGGSEADLAQARAACPLPVLRKDFIVDSWQVAETRAMGADCLLLILGALEPSHSLELEAQALELGLEVLVEFTHEHELERACEHRTPLLGVNNRDLHTLKTDTAHGLSLVSRLLQTCTDSRLIVAESGIRDAATLLAFREAGALAFLVGESLMRAPSLSGAARALTEAT